MESSVHDTPKHAAHDRYKVGDVVWPFRIQKVVGSGAMGDVYVAQHVTERNRVALKFMPESLRKDKVLLARFEREMKVLQDLRHPSIVRCLANVQEDDSERAYYAMEYVGGGTFEDLLRKRVRLKPEETFHYTVQTLGALATAHKNNVIHRDVKPSNLLLSKDHRAIKLCDFGLAMVLGGTQLTRPGQTIGTPWYMSPEQIRGEDSIGAAADLYSLGCILMEALTGKPPFDANTHFAILNKHLKEEPPLVSSRVPNMPNGAFVDRLVSRLLEKDPANRPSSAGELIAEIGKTFKLPELRHASTEAPKKARRKSLSDSGPQRTVAQTVSKDSSPIKVARARWQDFRHRLRLNQVTAIVPLLLGSLILNAVLLFAVFSGKVSDTDRDWIRTLPQQSEATRASSTPLLAVMASNEPAAEAALIEMLNAPEENVRYKAIMALGHLGKGASEHRAKVLALTHDPSSLVRQTANRTLDIIDGKAPPAELSKH